VSRFSKGLISSVVLAATTLAFSQGSSAAVSWSFSEDSVSLGLSGVSPHVEKTGAVDRLWYSGGPAGTAVADCSDAGSCAAVSANWGTPINDVSFATFGGVKRAYFKKMDPGSGTQAVYSAPCATADCVSIGAATLASEGMKVSMQERAWGVPDAVELPGGAGVRIYIVESPSKSSSCPEKVASYTSTDGVNFVKDAGYRFAKDGYVDTEVLRAKTGEWVMIMADGPGCGSHQKLYVSESTDGLSWSSPVALTGTDKSRLDPTGYETSPGSNVFKIYFAAAASGKSMDYTLGRGSMKVGSAATSPGAVATTKTAKIGASCTTAGAKSTVKVAKKSVKVAKKSVKVTCKKVKKKLVWSR
jgi:hypothetical protein